MSGEEYKKVDRWCGCDIDTLYTNVTTAWFYYYLQDVSRVTFTCNNCKVWWCTGWYDRKGTFHKIEERACIKQNPFYVDKSSW